MSGWRGILTGVSDLIEIRDAARAFIAEREWEQFQDPKSVMLALVGEVGELAELLQWLPAEAARELAHEEPLHTRLSEEMADVLVYLVGLADQCGVDLRAGRHRQDRRLQREAPGAVESRCGADPGPRSEGLNRCTRASRRRGEIGTCDGKRANAGVKVASPVSVQGARSILRFDSACGRRSDPGAAKAPSRSSWRGWPNVNRYRASRP